MNRDVLVLQISYEDFRLHLAQVYQQYERQQVHHLSDPALRQQHPVSTISGVDANAKTSTAKVTELKDTSDQGTQADAEDQETGEGMGSRG